MSNPYRPTSFRIAEEMVNGSDVAPATDVAEPNFDLRLLLDEQSRINKRGAVIATAILASGVIAKFAFDKIRATQE